MALCSLALRYGTVSRTDAHSIGDLTARPWHSSLSNGPVGAIRPTQINDLGIVRSYSDVSTQFATDWDTYHSIHSPEEWNQSINQSINQVYSTAKLYAGARTWIRWKYDNKGNKWHKWNELVKRREQLSTKYLKMYCASLTKRPLCIPSTPGDGQHNRREFYNNQGYVGVRTCISITGSRLSVMQT